MGSYLNLQVRPVQGKGRGVFATQEIFAGETIEVADVIVVSSTERPLLEVTVLDQYLFAWGNDEREAAVALGYGSLYNHSPHPNAKHVMNIETSTISFIALCDIKADDEITINYQGNPESARPLWFVPVGV